MSAPLCRIPGASFKVHVQTRWLFSGSVWVHQEFQGHQTETKIKDVKKGWVNDAYAISADKCK